MALHPTKPQGEVLSPEAAWDIARLYATPILEAVWRDKAAELGVKRGARPLADTDAYYFAWESADGDGSLSVQVSALSGRVTQVLLAMPRPRPAPVHREECIRFLAEQPKMQQYGGLNRDRIIWDSLNCSWEGESPHLGWRCEVLLDEPAADAGAGVVRVLCADLRPRDEGLVMLEVEEFAPDLLRAARELGESVADLAYSRQPQAIEDFSGDAGPLVLTGDGVLVCTSDRDCQTYPAWREEHPFVCVGTPDAAAAALTTPSDWVKGLGVSADGRWIGYRATSQIALIDRLNGRVYSLDESHGAIPLRMAVVSRPAILGRAGTWGEDRQWRLYEPPAGDAKRLTARPAPSLTDEDLAVALAPTEEGALIARLRRGPARETYEVDLARVDAGLAFVDRRTVVSDIAGEPSLSFFADGQRALVGWEATEATGGRLEVREHYRVVDLAVGKATPWEFPKLADPDGAKRFWHVVGTARAAGKDGVVFEGTADGWPPERGARIYTCKLDGSGLRRLTPLGDEPVPIYTFPETGKPAFAWPPPQGAGQ